MSLELDTLKKNDGICVIYNNTNGFINEFGCDWADFVKKLEEHAVTKKGIKKYFNREEIECFFDDNGLEVTEEELNGVF